jgi:3-hydroxyanthranilate 3,4-dioxygenase
MHEKIFITMRTEELFYQLEGSIKVIVQEDGRKEIELHPGDTYIRQNAAFSVRSDASIGAGNRAKRAGKSFTDGLLWYCDNCNHKLHEVYFELNNIEKTSCLTLKTSTSH